MRNLKATQVKRRAGGRRKFNLHIAFAGESDIVVLKDRNLTRVPSSLGESLAVMQSLFFLVIALKIIEDKDPRELDFSSELHSDQSEGLNHATPMSNVVTTHIM